MFDQSFSGQVCDPLGEEFAALPPAPRIPLDGLRQTVGRIERDEVRARAGRAMARGLLTHMHCVNTAREWAIIGGGPSINDHLKTIRKLKRRGVAIVSVNKTHDWLLSKGIVPWGHILLDPMEWVAGYVQRPRKDVRYFVASQCHDAVFDALKGYPVFLWHADQDFPEGPEPSTYLKEHYPVATKTQTWVATPGSTTVSLRAMPLGHTMGADKFHLIGLDSSRTPNGALHAYDKPEPPDAETGTMGLKHAGRKFYFDTNGHMARQMIDFDDMIKELPKHYASGRLRPQFELTVYGSGLLPFMAATYGLHADPKCNADPSQVGGYTRSSIQSHVSIPEISVAQKIVDDLGKDFTMARMQLMTKSPDPLLN